MLVEWFSSAWIQRRKNSRVCFIFMRNEERKRRYDLHQILVNNMKKCNHTDGGAFGWIAYESSRSGITMIWPIITVEEATRRKSGFPQWYFQVVHLASRCCSFIIRKLAQLERKTKVAPEILRVVFSRCPWKAPWKHLKIKKITIWKEKIKAGFRLR